MRMEEIGISIAKEATTIKVREIEHSFWVEIFLLTLLI